MLGRGPIAPGTNTSTPGQVSGGLQFVQLTAGEEHVCGLTPAGALYCWGKAHGQTNDVVLTPERIAGAPVFKSIRAGDYHTCGLTNAGIAYCWLTSEAPHAIGSNLRFAGLAGGQYYACGFTAGGAAYCWSVGLMLGYLGDGTGNPSFTPVRVATFPSP
jgi:alpha-tubulin suppressor-like RCC1 family protein